MSYIPADIIKSIIEYINFKDAQQLYLVSKDWQLIMENMKFPVIFRQQSDLYKTHDLFAFKMKFVLCAEKQEDVLEQLAKNNNIIAFKYIIEKHLSNIDKKHKLIDYSYYINIGCKNGHLELVKYLVSLGADITNDGNYTIRLASENGHLEVVKYFVSLGADITANDNEALRYASGKGYLDMVKYLVSLGADVTACDNEAVRWASFYGHLKVVKHLVSLGADIIANDNEAVRWSSRNGHLDVVKYLVSIGASLPQ